PPPPPLFPYTTLFRSTRHGRVHPARQYRDDEVPRAAERRARAAIAHSPGVHRTRGHESRLTHAPVRRSGPRAYLHRRLRSGYVTAVAADAEPLMKLFVPAFPVVSRRVDCGYARSSQG